MGNVANAVDNAADDAIDSVQERTNNIVDTVQDIGPDTFVDDIVDGVQEEVNQDIDIVQDIESVDDAAQIGVAVASMPANIVEEVGDFVIDTAQDHVNEAVDDSQNIVGDTFVDDIIDHVQEHVNDAVDIAQDLDSFAGGAIDHVQEHSNEIVDASQNIVGDTIVDDVIDTMQEHTNDMVDTFQQITGLTADDQYTAEESDWSGLARKVQGRHDPDGIDWIPRSAWKSWDGEVYNPNGYSQADFAELICPTSTTISTGHGNSIRTIRGLREVFYEHNPFGDNFNPTKAEVDEWHRIAMNHVRRMVGFDEIEKDHCLFLSAFWGNQRKLTTFWDSDYPAAPNGNSNYYGPCGDGGSSDPHCGFTFVPSAEDQAPYWRRPYEDNEVCVIGNKAEGIFPTRANDPWSIKYVRAFCWTLEHEGMGTESQGCHTTPFFDRPYFGWDFWDENPDDPDSNDVVLRAQWGGSRRDFPYR